MKSIVLYSMALLLCCAFSVRAQVLNGGFEDLVPGGTSPQHWGSIILFPFPLDSLKIDSALYFRNSDPHSGLHALELRNAVSTDMQFSGAVHLIEDDTNYIAFPTGMECTTAPEFFTFYYKFFPASSLDTALATAMFIDNETGEMIATAELHIGAEATSYTKASVPIIYTSSNRPSRVFINFATSTGNSAVTFGTRFIVDDVELSGTINHVEPKEQPTTILRVTCFPNPVTDQFCIRTSATAPLTVKFFSMLGEAVGEYSFTNAISIPMASYARGNYFYRILSAKGTISSGKLVLQ